LLGAVGDNFVTETLVPLDQDGDGVTDPLIRKILLVAPKVPDITFRDTERSAILSAEHSMFRAKAHKILTGGKSPGWVCAPSGNRRGADLARSSMSQSGANIRHKICAVRNLGDYSKHRRARVFGLGSVRSTVARHPRPRGNLPRAI
jgi:hypothetical protein